MFEKYFLKSMLQATLIILATTVPTGSLLSQIVIIDKLPYAITESGNYSLSHDLDATNLDHQYAIAISANDVNLDLGQHVLTLNTWSKGIIAGNVSNLSIHHGTIMANHPTGGMDSWAMELYNVTHATFDKITFLNVCVGAFLTNCTDHLITDCKFDSNYFSIWNDNTKGVTVRDCSFSSVLDSIKVLHSAEDLVVHRCNFHTFLAACIELYGDGKQTSNVDIDDCKFLIDYTSASYGIKLVGDIANAKIRNCTFLNNGEPSPAIICHPGVDLVIEGCSTPLNKIETRKNSSANGFFVW